MDRENCVFCIDKAKWIADNIDTEINRYCDINYEARFEFKQKHISNILKYDKFLMNKHNLYHNQPERSKREDSQKCEMRCSEHCGNTVRDK